MTDYSKLTDEELNHAVAERVMGWQQCVVDPDGRRMLWWWDGVTVQVAVDDWNPSTDHNDIALVRAEIKRRGLMFKFFIEVRRIGIAGRILAPEELSDVMVNATCRAQCEAALNAAEDVT